MNNLKDHNKAVFTTRNFSLSTPPWLACVIVVCIFLGVLFIYSNQNINPTAPLESVVVRPPSTLIYPKHYLSCIEKSSIIFTELSRTLRSSRHVINLENEGNRNKILCLFKAAGINSVSANNSQPLLRDLVWEFQLANGLNPDGKIGRATLKKLQEKITKLA